MNPEDTLSVLSTLTAIAIDLNRIANKLESQPVPAPNLVCDLSKYKGFDWASINAEIVAKDKHGAVAVRHSGKIYTRRNPANKFGVAIWYSRAAGKDAEDNNVYERLVTFKEVAIEADPLNEKTVAILRQLAAQAG